MFYFPQKGTSVPCTPLCSFVDHSFYAFGRDLLLAGALFKDLYSGFGRLIWGGWGIGMGWRLWLGLGSPGALTWIGLDRCLLPTTGVECLSLRWNPGPLDAPVCGLHQIDGNPTLDIYTRPWVGLPPLCSEATGYPLQGSRLLHTHKSINGGKKGVEVSALMEACLQVYFFLCPLRLLRTLVRRLRQMGLGISVHDVHVVSTDIPIMTEVTEQEVTLLSHGI